MFTTDFVRGGVPVKRWTRGVHTDAKALNQLQKTARLPIVHHHVAAMPDVHVGVGATVGSVVPTLGAIIPAAVGVDIGCGMMAERTSLSASDLPETLKYVRQAIERRVPHGRTLARGKRDTGAWSEVPDVVARAWREQLEDDFFRIIERHPRVERSNHAVHLGTLGTGNHFVELCLDEDERVWVMLHSGSRGVGNRIGSHFIRLAKDDMKIHIANLPDEDLAYLEEGTEHFADYTFAVEWAQRFARINRELMMDAVFLALVECGLPVIPERTIETASEGSDGSFAPKRNRERTIETASEGSDGSFAPKRNRERTIETVSEGSDGSFAPKRNRERTIERAVNCHHNYVQREHHFGEDCWVTRKGAVSARAGEMGIIPGSMGARSFIVRGKGNAESFHSCSHGAGRKMSRNKAKKTFSLDEHRAATEGIECRKDKGVLDETPGAYKDIDAVMAAQSDLVEVVHTLKQVVCVKG